MYFYCWVCEILWDVVSDSKHCPQCHEAMFLSNTNGAETNPSMTAVKRSLSAAYREIGFEFVIDQKFMQRILVLWQIEWVSSPARLFTGQRQILRKRGSRDNSGDERTVLLEPRVCILHVDKKAFRELSGLVGL